MLCGSQSTKGEGKVLDCLGAMGADTHRVCPQNQQLKNTSKPRSADTVTVNQDELVQTSSLPRTSCLTLSDPWVCVHSCTFILSLCFCVFPSAVSFRCRETRGTASPRLS